MSELINCACARSCTIFRILWTVGKIQSGKGATSCISANFLNPDHGLSKLLTKGLILQSVLVGRRRSWLVVLDKYWNWWFIFIMKMEDS